MGTRFATSTALLLAALLLALGAFATTAGAQDDGGAKKVLRMGWAQEPQTLNPFIDQDEEDFVVWSINWNLLVNFSPKDLGPAPGIARSWDISPDRRTVTFHLFPGAKWSDGQPLTSDDVKYSLETLGGNGALFTSYTDNVTAIETPDPETVVIRTKKPDARIVGGLFVYIIPKHVWGRTPVKQLLGSYRPEFPMVGSGPYVVTSFQRGRILKMERNPHFRGPRPKFDELQIIKYGSQDAVQRALQLGEIDLVREVDSAGFQRLGRQKAIKTVQAPSPSFTELAFNLCPRSICPDAKYNPAVQDRAVRQAIAYAVDRGRINTIANRGTSFVGHGLLPQYYKSFYEQPQQDYAYNPDEANRLLDAAGYKRGGDGIRAKGGTKLSFDLYVRSESTENIQAAKLVAEMARKVGVEFKVQVASVDKLTELTTQKKNGKMAPDFDTFIWGWGGDPYDPSILLNLLTTKAIGGSSDSFYSNPEYDRLYDEQSGQFDLAARKATVKRMIDIAQRDLPYLVLTVDPVLQAYRTDRIANVSRQCPQPDGDLLCDQVSYAPYLTMAPASAAAADSGGSSTALIVIAALVVLGVIAFLVLRARRRRRDREPLELET
jgi:peptide/nickel transport system substrate-binding protein